jgi:hypothetical protein
MKKIVSESLNEFMTEAQHGRTSKAKTVVQNKSQKAVEAIASLKKQLSDAKKPGQFKTTVEKNAKIKELGEKIKKWEAKKK